MDRCKKHGAEFWSVNNDWCSRCKWEAEREMERAEQDAAARLERVVERFERLSAATMSAADCMELNMPKLWKLAERIEAFIEQKRVGYES